MSALIMEETGQVSCEMRLRIFTAIDAEHIVHAVTDRSCEPMIARGEVAVVTDQDGLYPEPGGWYLFEFNKAPAYNGRERRTRSILTAYVDKHDRWWIKSPAPRAPGIISLSDGPFVDFNYLAERILGEVVGIYKPSSSTT